MASAPPHRLRAASVALLVTATSCVQPHRPAGPAASLDVGMPAPRERAVAEAAPLLAKLDLAVGAADLPPLAGDTSDAVARTPSFLDAARSADDATRAVDCMTAALYYEARSEPLDGQRAVAQVVLNRVRDRAFPNSVCGVVYQGSNRTTGCQFSFTCDGSLYRPRDPSAWERARLVATAALGGEGYAPIGAATHYHTTAILPWWAPSLRRIGLIGHHVFYRWAAPLERALSFRQSYAGIEPGAGAMLADGAGAWPGAGDTVMGVTIHRNAGDGFTPDAVATFAAQVENDVAVHRGLASGQGGAAAPALAAITPAERAGAPMLHGVRVHHGRDDAAAPEETPADTPGT